MKRTKKLLPAVLLLLVVAFSGCERNGNPQTWESVIDGVATITLDFYENENKYYSRVNKEPQSLSVLFADDSWTYYVMKGDTLQVIGENGDTDSNNVWLVNKLSETTMSMKYIGFHPTDVTAILHYSFNLKK